MVDSEDSGGDIKALKKQKNVVVVVVVVKAFKNNTSSSQQSTTKRRKEFGRQREKIFIKYCGVFSAFCFIFFQTFLTTKSSSSLVTKVFPV